MTTGAVPVYLIANPAIRKGPRWERRLTHIQELVPHAKLIGWDDLPDGFRHLPPADQPTRLAKALAGAIVAPYEFQRHQWIGRRALAEIDAFTSEGKTVYVSTLSGGKKLVRWDQCATATPDDCPRLSPVEIITPGQA